MKNHSRFLVLTIIFLLGKSAPEATAKEGEWVRIPSHWLLSRFVRSSSVPAHTYKIALAVPPGAKEAKIVQSSGSADIDEVAGSFAIESILSNGPLKTLAKSKELYFQFVVTPPMLDVKMRSKEGQRPLPPGKELYKPVTEGFIFTEANQNEPTARPGKLAVIFPEGGGYAKEAIVTVSSGNPAIDRYFLHNSALNWQASHGGTVHDTFSTSRPTRWQSILDP